MTPANCGKAIEYAIKRLRTFLNFCIDGHRIHQLGSESGCLDWVESGQVGCATEAADGFFSLQSRISCEKYSESLSEVCHITLLRSC